MLLKDVLEKINNKELTLEQVGEMNGISKRTVRRRLNENGIHYNGKTKKYEIAADYKAVAGQSMKYFFNSKAQREPQRAAQTSEKGATVINTPKEQEKAQSEPQTSEKDSLDHLLNAAPPSKRTYRGFYLDSDVLKVIDSVGDRKKSDLVNTALREIFKAKGRL